MTKSPRLVAAGLVLALPLASLALARPATAGTTSTTTNETVYTRTTEAGASVMLRDLETKRTTTVVATTADSDYDTPDLSPVGDKVALAYSTFTDTDFLSGIAVVARTGGTPTQLTRFGIDDNVFDVEPTFSPDGASILFTRVTITNPDAEQPTFSFALYTVPTAGPLNNATAVPGGTDGFGGSYNPTNPAQIVFTKVSNPETGDGDISTLTGGVVTDLGVDGRYPKFSPDGTTIAYSHAVNETSDRLATIPAAGGTATEFDAPVGGIAYVGEPSWLPDGESLVFDLARDEVGLEIWAVDARDTRTGVVVAATDTADASGPDVNGPAPENVDEDATSSTFVPVTPTRLLDTRTTVGGHLGKVGQGATATLQVTGTSPDGTVTVPADATAVVLNVTAVAGTKPTVVRVYPAPATPVAPTSSLNTIRIGQTVANQVTVKLPDATASPSDLGKVVLYNGTGSVDLIADIAGYYVPGTTEDGFVSVDPRRILDSRDGTGRTGKLGAASTFDLTVVGASLPVSGGGTVAVPAEATAVVLNVTATGSTASTNIRVFPKPASGSAVPTVSNLNLAANETVPNLVTVQIGDAGKVRFFNQNGSVHLIADIAGYYTSATDGAAFVPVVPARFLDTRAGIGAAPIITTQQGFVDLLIQGARGVDADAVAAVINLTGTQSTAPTNIRAYPATSSTPTVSNLNLIKGDSRANAAVVKPGTDGRVRILNSAGDVHLIADLSGFFVPIAG